MTVPVAAKKDSSVMQDSSITQHSADQGFLELDDVSPVGQMFNGSSIFITGASGFIGRVLLEKLLRCYEGIKHVYILMRPKKNVSPADRLEKQLLNAPIFDHIRALKNGRELLAKIVVVNGDIGHEQLGMSDEDVEMLTNDESLSIVFHSAATVKFDEPLKNSIKFNLRATQAIIELCKKLPNLVALCHVSTAYVNSDIKDGRCIEEKMYPMEQTPEQVLKMSETLNDQMLQHLKPMIVEERPNTYTFTKALGEHLIALEASELPVAIVRPSIVVAAWKEPLEGWIDNLNGPTGLILAIGKGLLRSMHTVRNVKADMIPVDIVVNTMIASCYYAAKRSGKLGPELPALPSLEVEQIITKEELTTAKQQQQQAVGGGKKESESEHIRVPPIFHCNSGDINSITWGRMEDLFFAIIRKYPSIQVFRYPFGTFKRNKYHDIVTRWFVHLLPALIIDLLCMAMGKKQQLLNIYFKLHSAIQALSHFSTTNYNFQSKNIKILQESLTHPRDRQQLYMDISSLDWYNFWDTYTLGCRRYVLKEDDSTLQESRYTFRRARYLEYAYRAFWLLLAIFFFGPMLMRAAPVLVNTIRRIAV